MSRPHDRNNDLVLTDLLVIISDEDDEEDNRRGQIGNAPGSNRHHTHGHHHAGHHQHGHHQGHTPRHSLQYSPAPYPGEYVEIQTRSNPQSLEAHRLRENSLGGRNQEVENHTRESIVREIWERFNPNQGTEFQLMGQSGNKGGRVGPVRNSQNSPSSRQSQNPQGSRRQSQNPQARQSLNPQSRRQSQNPQGRQQSLNLQSRRQSQNPQSRRQSQNTQNSRDQSRRITYVPQQAQEKHYAVYKVDNQLGTQPGVQLRIQPETQPRNQPGFQQGFQPGGQQGFQPGGQQGFKTGGQQKFKTGGQQGFKTGGQQGFQSGGQQGFQSGFPPDQQFQIIVKPGQGFQPVFQQVQQGYHPVLQPGYQIGYQEAIQANRPDANGYIPVILFEPTVVLVDPNSENPNAQGGGAGREDPNEDSGRYTTEYKDRYRNPY